ncbi:4Fe-4S binding protein, partial [Myxococcota bacterium]|nr:4Fe-4S binding protein [Myxococcota bacterium]
FVGKSGNLIVPGFGPNVVLGEIVTTLALPPTTPSPMDTCGECKLCVDACPTGAIMGDGFINTRKCLSYFTTEARENPPDSAALAFGGRLFGCEECVAACPHKRPMEPLGENPLPMERYYQLPQLPARSTFRGTALSRLGYTKIMVNLCYSLTARSDSPALALLHELAEHSSAAISAAARHALRLKSR